ncbi:hypothetical protein Z042_17840 [Chania multitudinisentens RB-25]|uniref:Dit-like phage tail protein N-terminal domain-containing protein n=1 Tax=Chania multitudinisentens RB-25 TaxID=1441930 RepID=W0LH23_9GAMM|nr:hypothetical protein [Chania multitudinisentens]AHG21255.1 hypothetical protein Z042_17840 [Chania multitudinisentens RB-25]
MDLLSVLFNQQKRRIGVIVPSIVISERHSDSTVITEHPVGFGAAINDHAYNRPAELVMELGFAGAGSLVDFFDTSQYEIAGQELSIGTNPKEIYQQLLDLQNTFEYFDVTTGKRQYKNMLIRSLNVTTDAATENVLMITLAMQQINITNTQTVTETPVEDMAQGQNTAGVANTGVKNPLTVNPNNMLRAFVDSVTGAIKTGVSELKGVMER